MNTNLTVWGVTRVARLSRPPVAAPGHSPPRVTAWPASSPGKWRLRTAHTWTWQVSVFCCIQLPANCHLQTSKTEIIGLSYDLFDRLNILEPVYNLLRTNYRVVRENHLRDRSDALHCRFRREQNMLCEFSHPSASHRIMLSNGDSQ